MASAILKRMAPATALVPLLAAVAVSQVRVDMARSATIPHDCKAIKPASLEPEIEVSALIKEALCKGSGDLMVEYTYTMEVTGRAVDKQGKSRGTTTTYEVFMPTLKAGTRARGILIETAKDGVPVPPQKLESDRRKAGERLEKEEARIDREAPAVDSASVKEEGMTPLGTYSRTSVNRSALGVNHTTMAFTIVSFLRACNFTFQRRETIAGRPALIFKFDPQPEAKFKEGESYIAQLTGEIAIDVEDRIVTRLAGWPQGIYQSSSTAAVYQEMTRTKEGVWLPSIRRINGADYPKLFERFTSDFSSTFSNYVRFVSEIQDVKVNQPPN